MSETIYDTKTPLDNSGFLAAIEKIREATDKSISMMSAIGESIGGLGVKVAGLSVPGGIKDAMEQGRQFAAQARRASPPVSALAALRQVFQSAGVSGKDMDTKKPAREPASIDHFKTPDADRFAKLGLFIGSAPQTPGLGEAKRTAQATEAIKKGIDKLNVYFTKNNIKANVTAAYAE